MIAGAIIVSAVPGLAQQKMIETSLTLPTTSLTLTAAYVAEDAGFWEKEGLKVSTRVITGVGAMNAVIAGSVDFTMSTGSTFARAAVRGQRLLAIANVVDRPQVEFVLRKDVADAAGIRPDTPIAERAKALRGKTIAIDGVQSVIHAFTMLVARKGGVDPEKDMRVSPMSPSSMLAALKSKQVDGYATSLPWSTQGIQSGDAVMLASGPMADLPEFIPYAYMVVMTRPEVCKNSRETCERMGRSMKSAAAFIRERPDETLEILKKRFPQMEPGLLAAAFKVAHASTAKDVRVTTEALDKGQQFNVSAGVLKADEILKSYDGLVTDEFVK
jgi:ABC-type nitrate/sulfonate/bicarbonate transport system substrate-binding protein